MSYEKIRIGFVGVGTMGQCAHLKNYAALGECKVVALAELRPELARRVANRYEVPAVYESHEQMLETEDLNGIVASQPYNRHGVLVPDLAEAGVPIFTEKPLAGSVEVGQRVLEAVQTAGIAHMVGYHKLSDPATERAIREIERLKRSGELGNLRYVRILMPAGDWVAGGFNGLIQTEEDVPDLDMDPPPSDMDEATRAEYDAFVNYYIHQVNLMRHLMGESYEVTYADPAGVLMTVRSENGIAGTLEMSPYKTTLDWQESALVAFERGWIRLELPAPLASNRPGKVEIYHDAGQHVEPTLTRPQLSWEHAMRRQAKKFLAVIRGEADPPSDAAEALEDLRVARYYVLMRSGA